MNKSYFFNIEESTVFWKFVEVLHVQLSKIQLLDWKGNVIISDDIHICALKIIQNGKIH